MACWHRFKKRQKGLCLRCRVLDNKYVFYASIVYCVILYFTGIHHLYWKIYDLRHKEKKQ